MWNLAGKRPCGRNKRRWKDIIKTDLHEIWDCVDWIYLSQDVDVWLTSVVNTVLNLRGRYS